MSFLSGSSALSEWFESDIEEQEAMQKFPLLRYSLHHMLDHANTAERLGMPQTVLLNKIEDGTWPEYYDRLVGYPLRLFVILPLVVNKRLHPKFPTDLGLVLGVLGQIDLLSRWYQKDESNEDFLFEIAPHLIGQLLTVNDDIAIKTASWIGQLVVKNDNIDIETLNVILDLLRNLPMERLLYDDRATSWMLTLLNQDFKVNKGESIKTLCYAVESRNSTAIKLFRDRGVCDFDAGYMLLTIDGYKKEDTPSSERKLRIEHKETPSSKRNSPFAEMSELRSKLSTSQLNDSDMAYVSRIRTILAVKMSLVSPETNEYPVIKKNVVTALQSIQDEITKYGSRGLDAKYIENLPLLGTSVDLNCKESRNQTPLHAAAEYGNLQVVQRLLAHNANIEAEDGKGLTALAYAVQQKNHDLTQLLLLHRASLYTPDRRGITPLTRAFTAAGVDMRILPDDFVTTSNDYTILCSLYDDSFRTIAELPESSNPPTPRLSPESFSSSHPFSPDLLELDDSRSLSDSISF